MIEKDEKEHAGNDEATVNLVQQLQTDCEKEIKSEQKEPFKYDEKYFFSFRVKIAIKGKWEYFNKP